MGDGQTRRSARTWGFGADTQVCPYAEGRFLNLSAKDLDRFWSKVDRRGVLDCWWWLGSMCQSGVPHFFVKGGANGTCVSPLKVMFELEYGRGVELNEAVIRTCGNAHCVNPAHLAVGPKGLRLASWRKSRRHRQDRLGLEEMVWMAGMELELLANGRYKVVRV